MDIKNILYYIEKHCPEAAEMVNYLTASGEKWLFGCGMQAQNCLYMMQLLGMCPCGCIVTQPQGEVYQTLPVKAAGSNEVNRESSVLIAVNEKAAPDIRDMLLGMGYTNVFVCYDWEKTNDVIKEAIFWDYCNAHHVNIQEDWIILGKDYRYLNPFFYPKTYRQMLFGTTFSELIVPGLFGEDIYGYRELYQIVEKKLEEAETVFDIGANAGVFSVYATSFQNKVAAFEPSNAILPYLKKNTEDNPAIQVVEAVVLDREDTVNYYDREDYPKYSTIEEHSDYKCYRASAITLDSFIEGSGLEPEVIRIDVSECLYRILMGGEKYIMKKKPALLVKAGNEEHKKKVADILQSYAREYHVLCWNEWMYISDKGEY